MGYYDLPSAKFYFLNGLGGATLDCIRVCDPLDTSSSDRAAETNY
jgi:hypothetical protein